VRSGAVDGDNESKVGTELRQIFAGYGLTRTNPKQVRTRNLTNLFSVASAVCKSEM
jgi:hypothetical protein